MLDAYDAQAVVVRPDRYVLGTAATAENLERLLDLVPPLSSSLDGPARLSKTTQGALPMTFSPITHLRHVDLAVEDYDKQVAFYRDHWGLTPVGTDSGLTYFAAEGSPEQYVIRVREATDKRLDVVSFGVADRAAADALALKLATAGVQLVGEPDELQTPGGGYGFRFFDLEGRTIEIAADVAPREHRKIEQREDIPVRLSHVVLNSPDPAKMRDWYSEHLGFRLSDTLNHPRVGDLFYFMRCNAKHHSMGIARGPHASLQHVSFDLRGVDEYMFGSPAA